MLWRRGDFECQTEFQGSTRRELGSRRPYFIASWDISLENKQLDPGTGPYRSQALYESEQRMTEAGTGGIKRRG